ncbi:MAG: LCP family protein, partial [Acidimicrobiia bacterium]
RGTPLWAGIQSALVPGWGQVSTGHPVVGWTLVAVSLAIGAFAAAWVVTVGPTEVLARLADPTILLAILALNVFMAGLRLSVSSHAWWEGGGRRFLALLVLWAVVLAPHVAVGWVGTQTRDAMLDIFHPAAGPPPPGASPPPSAGATTSSTTAEFPEGTRTDPPGESATSTIPVTSSTVPPSTTSTTATTTTTLPPTTSTSLPLGTERLTVLLLGGDAGPGRPGLRTDTIMVATVDTTTGAAALFGIPRNFGGISFSDGTPFPLGPDALLNEVYGWGRANPAAFGGLDPGASAVTDVAEHITGLEIDYFALVDLTGFPEVVDAFGGVELDVPQAVDAPLYDPRTGGFTMIRIPAGPQRLDGGEAMAYSRARYGSSDYDRMGRQRCVVSALADQVDPIRTFARLPLILDAIRANVTTDMPVDLVPDLLRLADRVTLDRVAVVGFGPDWASGRTQAGVNIPDIERIRVAVYQTIIDPDLAGDQSGILTADEAC